MKDPNELTEAEKYELAKAEHMAHMHEKGLEGCWDCLPISAQMRVLERAVARYRKQYNDFTTNPDHIPEKETNE